MPAIRYCTTPAGRVAYSTAGAGPPLLCDSGWITHLRGQLELFSFASFMARLAERFTVIRYDKPGCGLSDRDGIDLSFDGQVAAALAVADAARAGRFSLFGASQGGQLAAAIAAKCPERVEALVLYGTCANGADQAPAEVRDSILALMRAHWGLGSKVLAGIFIPDPSAEDVEALNRLQRASASDGRGPRREHPAQAGGPLARPDRGLGDPARVTGPGPSPVPGPSSEPRPQPRPRPSRNPGLEPRPEPGPGLSVVRPMPPAG
jgi:pimeloyl-ACP methyl ester carboxylesterase